MNFNCIFTILKKELKDMIRDKKTVIIAIIVPLIIFPILLGVLGKSMEYQNKKITDNVKIAIDGEQNSNLIKNLKSKNNISIFESTDIKEDLINGKAYCGIIISKNFETDLLKDKQPEVKIIYDDSSQNSEIAISIIKSYIEEYSNEISNEKLQSKGIDSSILKPITVNYEIAEKDNSQSGNTRIMLSFILPLVLLMYAMSNPIPTAIDLGAGEKERGTLEPLLTTKASRMQLFLGKVIAIAAMGITGTISSLLGLIISFRINGNMFGGNLSFSLTAKAVIWIFIFVLMLVLISAAVELSISIYARSFKEAQTYLMPMSFIAILVSYGTYAIDTKSVASVLFNIPIVNTALILKEIINEIYNPIHMTMTFIWGCIYIILAIIFANHMFNKEDVIFRS